MKRALKNPVVHVVLLWCTAAALGGVAVQHDARIGRNERLRDAVVDTMTQIDGKLNHIIEQLGELNDGSGN